jgi:hypothetical protein
LGSSKYESGITLNAYFIDRHDALLDKVEVTRSKAVTPDWDALQAAVDVRTEALTQFKTDLTGILGPEQAEAIAAQPAATGLTVEERLRNLDDLVRKGLISDDEAAAKRVEILKGL